MTKCKHSNSYVLITGIAVFLGIFIYYLHINPLVVYDSDDWLYIYLLRKPIPMLNAWNPTKIFPEVSMPLVSYFGALIIYPIIDNYFLSLTVAHALFAALLLIIYYSAFIQFSKRKLGCNNTKSTIIYGLIFLLLHFVSHITLNGQNSNVLTALNLTCFYNYTLAVIINASLVMIFMSYGGINTWRKNSNFLNKIIIIMWLYFALNSNLYASVVMATYIGTSLTIDLFYYIKEKKKGYIKDNLWGIIIILCWFTINLLETMGGRADSMKKSFMENIVQTIKLGIGAFLHINPFIIVFFVIIFILGIKVNASKNYLNIIRFVLYIGFQFVYLVILSSYVQADYICREEVFLCSYFYLTLGALSALSTLNKVKVENCFILIILGTILLISINTNKEMKKNNCSQLSYIQCEAVMNDIINQFKEAENAGESEVIIEIPRFDAYDNWPLCSYIGERYSNALYLHKITNSYIEVVDIIFSYEKNEEFGIEP